MLSSFFDTTPLILEWNKLFHTLIFLMASIRYLYVSNEICHLNIFNNKYN